MDSQGNCEQLVELALKRTEHRQLALEALLSVGSATDWIATDAVLRLAEIRDENPTVKGLIAAVILKRLTTFPTNSFHPSEKDMSGPQRAAKGRMPELLEETGSFVLMNSDSLVESSRERVLRGVWAALSIRWPIFEEHQAAFFSFGGKVLRGLEVWSGEKLIDTACGLLSSLIGLGMQLNVSDIESLLALLRPAEDAANTRHILNLLNEVPEELLEQVRLSAAHDRTIGQCLVMAGKPHGISNEKDIQWLTINLVGKLRARQHERALLNILPRCSDEVFEALERIKPLSCSLIVDRLKQKEDAAGEGKRKPMPVSLYLAFAKLLAPYGKEAAAAQNELLAGIIELLKAKARDEEIIRYVRLVGDVMREDLSHFLSKLQPALVRWGGRVRCGSGEEVTPSCTFYDCSRALQCVGSGLSEIVEESVWKETLQKMALDNDDLVLAAPAAKQYLALPQDWQDEVVELFLRSANKEVVQAVLEAQAYRPGLEFFVKHTEALTAAARRDPIVAAATLAHLSRYAVLPEFGRHYERLTTMMLTCCAVSGRPLPQCPKP